MGASSPFLTLPESAWVASNELAFAILDRFPVSPGHTLIVTRRLVETWFNATPEEQSAVWALVNEVKRRLDEEFHPDGYNIGLNLGAAAGAGVPGHLHWHIVPRWHGDTNFMPILADTKVIVQSLDALYDLLRERLSGPVGS